MKYAPMIVSLALAATAASAADTIDLQFVGTGAGANVKVMLDSLTEDVFAGQIIHNFSNGTGDAAALNGQHFTFCTEATQFVAGGGATYNVTDVAGALDTNSNAPAKGQAIGSALTFAGYAPFEAGANADLAAAWQIAIWEITYDYNPDLGSASLDLTAGHLRIANTDGNSLTSSISTYVAAMFAAVGGGSGGQNALIGFENGGTQNQIVPAPGAIAIAGLAGLCVSRRRR